MSDVRGHFPYHGYPHPTDHDHDRLRLERYYAPPRGCVPNMSGVYQDLAVIARLRAAVIRRRAWDLRARPFQHRTFGTLGDAVAVFVPGPTWEYVPPRDRPEALRRRTS